MWGKISVNLQHSDLDQFFSINLMECNEIIIYFDDK